MSGMDNQQVTPRDARLGRAPFWRAARSAAQSPLLIASLSMGALSGLAAMAQIPAPITDAANAADEITDADIARRVAQWRAVEQEAARELGAGGLAERADALMQDVDLRRLTAAQIRAGAEILRSSPQLLDAMRTLLAERAQAPGPAGYSASLDWFFVARHAPSGMTAGGLGDPQSLERDLAALLNHSEFPRALRRGEASHVVHALTRVSPETRSVLSPAVFAAIHADMEVTPAGLYSASSALATIARDADARSLADARTALLAQLEAAAGMETDPEWSRLLRQLSGLVRSPYLGRSPSERTAPDSLLALATSDAVAERRLSDFAGGVVVLVVTNGELTASQVELLRGLRSTRLGFPNSDSTSFTTITLLPRTDGAPAPAATAARSEDVNEGYVARCDPLDWHDSSVGFSLESLANPRVFVLDANGTIVDGDLNLHSMPSIESAIGRALAVPKRDAANPKVQIPPPNTDRP